MRLEYKYILPAVIADRVFDEVGRYLMDVTAQPAQAEHYGVNSLYFDDRRMSCYWDKKNGQNERQKIRFRQYDDRSEIYCEKKFSRGELRWKVRAPVGFHCFESFVGRWHVDGIAGLPSPPDFFVATAASGLRPAAWVNYGRRALNFGNMVRISLDQDVAVAPYVINRTAGDGQFVRIFNNRADALSVFEVKVPRRFQFLSALRGKLERFRASNSKYCLAIEAIQSRAAQA